MPRNITITLTPAEANAILQAIGTYEPSSYPNPNGYGNDIWRAGEAVLIKKMEAVDKKIRQA